jgi:hypothetical protein
LRVFQVAAGNVGGEARRIPRCRGRLVSVLEAGGMIAPEIGNKRKPKTWVGWTGWA